MPRIKVWNGSAWTTAVVGARGNQGPTGGTGSNGSVAVTSPITNSGTSSSAQLGLDQTLLPKGFYRKMIGGRYYFPSSTTGSRSTVTYSLGNAYYGMFEVPNTTTFDRIITGVSRGVTNSVIRMGIYNSDPDTLLPSTLVLDAGTVSTGSNFTVTNVTASAGTVTYTANNTLTAGEVVSIAGVNPSAYNLTGVTVATASSTQFTVTNAATGAYVSGGTGATVVYPSITINQTLSAGLYYLVWVVQVASGPTAYYFNGNTACTYTAAPTSAAYFGGSYYQGGITGALPATATPVLDLLQIVCPYVGMRAV